MPAYVEAEHEVWVPELGAHAPDACQFFHGRRCRYNPRSRTARGTFAVVTHARQNIRTCLDDTRRRTVELVSCVNNNHRAPARGVLTIT